MLHSVPTKWLRGDLKPQVCGTNQRFKSRSRHFKRGEALGIRDRLFGGRFHQPPPDQAPLSDAAIMNTGGDEYVGCIVQADEVESMIEVALRAGIQARLEAF